MLVIAIRKMLSNKWMFLCTLIGSIVSVAMLSCIPIYTNGIMQRMLIRDLENYQIETGDFPGGYLVKYGGSKAPSELVVKSFESIKNEVNNSVFPGIKLPILTQCTYMNARTARINTGKVKTDIHVKISALTELEQHVEILHGKMYSKNKVDGVYEVIVSEEAVKVLGLTPGNTYELIGKNITGTVDPTFRIRIAGIFTTKEANDPYWFTGLQGYSDQILMDSDLFLNSFLKEGGWSLYEVKFYTAYDYHQIKLENLPSLVKEINNHNRWFIKNRQLLEHTISSKTIIEQYEEREKQLKISLIIFQVPILIILAFYSFMVSRLKVDFENNEIAVIKSRGGSSLLVFAIYLIESLVIGATALILGPILGRFLCTFIGASNGFLEFVQRSALPISFTTKTFTYSLAAVFLFAISMLIPAFRASRSSIVLYKQSKARDSGTVFWKKYFLDVILLCISLYGYYSYIRQQKVLFVSGVKGTDLSIDPLIFLISTTFVFGCGLLVLRIFPYIIKFIFHLGGKFWSPVFYAAFTQISRTSGKEQFAMIFVILTLSIGLFSANSARTINKNIEEKVYYETGADIVVKGHWSDNSTEVSSSVAYIMGDSSAIENEITYFEPDYSPYTELKGIETTTKVFRQENAEALVGDEYISNVYLMGLIPHEFCRTAWFKASLLPYHWYSYMNMLTDAPTAILASTAFRDNLGVEEGDIISIDWGRRKWINVIVYGFIDYWPAINPNRKVNEKPAPYYVVSNLDYLHAMRPVEPYEVWMKKKPGATSSEVYKDITDKGIKIVEITDATESLIKNKNDPLLQGMNGFLTLGFLVTIVISIIGFLIYWVMSVKKRVLQFGILRAMGLSSNKIIGILACEQVLITGVSVFAGIGIGGLTSKIFIPMFQLIYSTEDQVPPFSVISQSSDYIKLYVIVAFMLITAFTVLWRIIAKINIGQAIKLGED